jgi:hypothetical protein
MALLVVGVAALAGGHGTVALLGDAKEVTVRLTAGPVEHDGRPPATPAAGTGTENGTNATAAPGRPGSNGTARATTTAGAYLAPGHPTPGDGANASDDGANGSDDDTPVPGN